MTNYQECSGKGLKYSNPINPHPLSPWLASGVETHPIYTPDNWHSQTLGFFTGLENSFMEIRADLLSLRISLGKLLALRNQ